MADLEICPRYAQLSKSTPFRLPDRFLLGNLINESQFPHTNSPDWLPWILVVFGCTTASLSGGACLKCPGRDIHFWQRQTDRQSYAFIASEPMPSSHESPGQWNQAPVTLITEGGVGKKPNLMNPRLTKLAPPHWPLNDNETALLFVHCVKFHSISCKTHLLELGLNSNFFRL